MKKIADIIAFATVIAVIMLLMLSCYAFAHDGHTVTNVQYRLQMQRAKPIGRIQPGSANDGDSYLFGMNREDPQLNIINCCLLHGMGDCQMVKAENVKVVAGGYEWQGEFIPEAEATVSPDDSFYGCKHKGKPRSHCFFAPGVSY